MTAIRLSDCDGVYVIIATDRELTYGDVDRIRKIATDVKFPEGEMINEWQFDELVDEIIEKCKTELGITFSVISPDYDVEI